jgi:tetratricopeptide (TPR) repeat protein
MFIAIALCIVASTALASWYDDYDAGLAAAEKGQWSVVVQKMTSAINGNAKEGGKTRTYGAIFINYHPYYYRGAAYLNLGKYQQAIDDLDKATGLGPTDLGTIEALHERAAAKLQAATAPPLETPVLVAPRPTPPAPISTAPPAVSIPAAPVIDPALRQRADNAIAQAKGRLQAAQQRKATASPPYAQAMQSLNDANLRRASAKTNDELNQVAALAENAALLADSATAPGLPPAPAPTVAAIIPKPLQATGDVMADAQKRVRLALEHYFAGEFETSAREFSALTKDLPRNGLIWAFLGASQYAQFAFERDPAFEDSARASFRKAKELRPALARNGLSERYFSRRVRTFFKSVS